MSKEIREMIDKVKNFKQSVNEQFENNIKDNIMFSVLSDGFMSNNRYGNPKTNYYSFDVRSDNEVMGFINKSEPFIRMINKKGKDYKIVGLALNTNNPEVENLRNKQNWVGGRNGYVFATIENSENLPSNIDEILINEAINSAKFFFKEIKNWDDAIKIPNL
jgi:deoxycytidine triphosphate deaminase